MSGKSPSRRRPHAPWRRHLHGPATVLVGGLLLAGCGGMREYVPTFLTPYRTDVQQGNIVTAEMAENLHPGLTRDQVRYILGTPMLVSVFHLDRWDYVYFLKRRDGETQRRKLTVVFVNNRVESIAHDVMPPESMADNLILGRRPSSTPAQRPPVDPASAPSAPNPAQTAPAPGTPTNPTQPATQP